MRAIRTMAVLLISIALIGATPQNTQEQELPPLQEGETVTRTTEIKQQTEPQEQDQEEPQEEPEQEESETTIDEADLELLAHLIMAEAGGCSETIQHLVGCVALNRVNSEWFPDTLEEVIWQPGQYACTWLGSIEKEPTEQCYSVAEELLQNGPDIPADVVWQAEFIQGSSIYLHLGNQYFCHK